MRQTKKRAFRLFCFLGVLCGVLGGVGFGLGLGRDDLDGPLGRREDLVDGRAHCCAGLLELLLLGRQGHANAALDLGDDI